MELQKIEQYDLDEKELKEAVKMFFELKKEIELTDDQISFYADVDGNYHLSNFTGHIKITTTSKDA